MAELIIFGIALAATYFGVGAFRHWSLRKGLLDVPNDRSSHDSPTPRGGGLIIVAVSLLLYSYITLFLTHNFSLSYVAAAGLVALISWMDDLYSVSSILRLFVHAVAAVLLIWGVGFPMEIYVPGFDGSFHVGGFGSIIAFFWIVWMVNAYNFMDGIDGLAGSQAAVAGFAWLILGYIAGFQSVYYFGGVLAFSSIGFLIHNWSPAKVFMGDVGSAFLGFTFAAIPLIAPDAKTANAPLVFSAGVLFVWFFLFDTVFTFIRRALRGEKVWTAHREHLYQRMTVAGLTHGSVTSIYTGFAALVVGSLFIGFRFRGSWDFLTLFVTVLLSATVIFCSFRKKKIDVSIGKC